MTMNNTPYNVSIIDKLTSQTSEASLINSVPVKGDYKGGDFSRGSLRGRENNNRLYLLMEILR